MHTRAYIRVRWDTNLEGGNILACRGGGDRDGKEGRKRYASHCVRRTRTGKGRDGVQRKGARETRGYKMLAGIQTQAPSNNGPSAIPRPRMPRSPLPPGARAAFQCVRRSHAPSLPPSPGHPAAPQTQPDTAESDSIAHSTYTAVLYPSRSAWPDADSASCNDVIVSAAPRHEERDTYNELVVQVF